MFWQRSIPWPLVNCWARAARRWLVPGRARAHGSWRRLLLRLAGGVERDPEPTRRRLTSEPLPDVL
eukprot:11217229-Lingulodinium_polyedra.AAC.1